VVYEASSPDEEALVDAAAGVGVVLQGRTNDSVSVSLADGSAGETFRIVRELEFTSHRKRMSVILQRTALGSGGGMREGVLGAGVEVGGLIMLVKGADEAVCPLLAGGQEVLQSVTQQHIDGFASYGLRTLLVACRRVDPLLLAAWEAGPLAEANATIAGREARVALAYEQLEQGLLLLGGTAIEDGLQAAVPASMRVLREAGIRVWMVTGDKQSTASQVAVASGILPPSHSLVTFSNPAHIDQNITQLAHLVEGGVGGRGAERTPVALVLTGACLAAMSHTQGRLFIRSAARADAAICCRLTPDQKARLRSLLRSLFLSLPLSFSASISLSLSLSLSFSFPLSFSLSVSLVFSS